MITSRSSVLIALRLTAGINGALGVKGFDRDGVSHWCRGRRGLDEVVGIGWGIPRIILGTLGALEGPALLVGSADAGGADSRGFGRVCCDQDSEGQ